MKRFPIGIFLAGALLLSCTASSLERRNSTEVRLDLSSDIRALGSDDLEISDPAENKLLALGPTAIPVLVRALDSEPDPVARLGIVGVLRKTGAPSAIEPIKKAAIEDLDPEVRREALVSLAFLKVDDTEAIALNALSHPDWRVRSGGVALCEQVCSSPQAAHPMVNVALAADQRSLFGGSRKVLASWLRGSSPQLVDACTESIETEASEILQTFSSASNAKKVRAALLLTEIGDTRGLDILHSTLADRKPANLVSLCLWAVGDIGNAESVPLLVSFQDDVRHALNAYDSLGRLSEKGTPGASNALSNWEGRRLDTPLPRLIY